MGWGLLIGAAICGPIAVVLVTSSWRLVSGGVWTTGTVAALHPSSGGNGTVYRPEVTFTDKKGQQHTHYSGVGSYPPSYEVGEHVPIIYNSDDPKDATVDSFLALWMLPVAFANAAFFLFAGGLACLLYGPRILRRLSGATDELTANEGRVTIDWFKIRLVILAVVFGMSLVQSFFYADQFPRRLISSREFALFGLIGLVLFPFMIAVVIGLQRFSPFSDKTWRRPTHHDNPFQFGNPLPFVHFAIFLNAAWASAMILSSLWNGTEFLRYGIVQMLGSLSVWTGLLLSMRICRRKISHSESR